MKKSILVVVLAALALLVGCIDEHMHVFDREVVSEKYLASEATEKAAATYYKCCACGEKGSETFSYGNPVSRWNGTVSTRESDYVVNPQTGFLKENAKGEKSLADSWKDAACIGNAKEFIAWFKGEFVDTGRIELRVDGDEKNSSNHRIAYATVYSAQALASLDLLQDYFAAECIVRANEKNNLFNDYYYWATADCAVEVSVAVDMDLNGSDYNWTPVVCPYPVDFQGHVVSNLECVHPGENNVALFVSTAVSNLVLRGATVEGGQYVAAVTAGCSKAIDNVRVEHSSIAGEKYVGAIVGHSYSNISNSSVYSCNVMGNAQSAYQVGGIVGFQCQGVISNCTVSGSTVKAPKEAGGIAGRVYIQSEFNISVVNNVVASTKVRTLDDEVVADSFIGKADAYLGFICGGGYLPTNDGNSYEGYPNSGYASAKCTISGNTVDSVKH